MVAGYGQKTTKVISSVIARELHSYLLYQLGTERRNHFGYLVNIKKKFKNTCGFDLLSDWKSKIHTVLLTK
jgi:hypothetical protein